MQVWIFALEGVFWDQVREVLSRACVEHGVLPSEWTFERSPSGKPHISGPTRALPLAISVSHTGKPGEGGIGVLALSTELPALGVDAELMVREVPRAGGLAKRFFTPEEQNQYQRLGATSGAFLQVWTEKEARAKALGRGVLDGNDGYDALQVVRADSAEWGVWIAVAVDTDSQGMMRASSSIFTEWNNPENEDYDRS